MESILAVRQAPEVLEGEEHMLEDEIDIEETRREHLEKTAGDGKEIVEVVPRMSATTRPLSGRWVDS